MRSASFASPAERAAYVGVEPAKSDQSPTTVHQTKRGTYESNLTHLRTLNSDSATSCHLISFPPSISSGPDLSKYRCMSSTSSISLVSVPTPSRT